ncbi:serine hydrolase domain-containing protein [Polaribacter sp. Z022]|uniref:serine hydrolase domain-containing protein n=1 Tax=Polaribacter sp. Z022 TaxID=2927125 RepID=UPI0020215D7E|nr:serine hydrolase domain-containing protein [Polaribacter sp. Z022]MCL7754861.1 beta-lactamase family protein [Polaribacter sp. Z022]
MFRIILIVSSLASFSLLPWILVKAWISPLPNTVQKQVDKAVKYGFEGVVVYVDQAGKNSKSYTSGWHNKEAKIPAKPDALYKIASISKLYDAVAVTKLVSSGKLSLDKTLADYLPELKGKIENIEKITLRLLIQHRSGIPNFTDAPNFWAEPTSTYEESLALIEGKSAKFKPGKKYDYCNTNYLLINKIMDDVLGYPNFKFIQKEILNPLNLKNTFSSVSKVNIDNVMSGYHVGYPNDLKTNDYGMHATAKDVATFMRALNTGTIFKNNEQEIYTSIYKLEHDGWVPGYQSFAKYYKKIDTVVIYFYSTTDPKLLNWNLSQIINKKIYRIIKKSINEG